MNQAIAFPYRITPGGQTARATVSGYLEQLLEQIMFVDVGERVNRPEFGCALGQLVFDAGISQLTTAVEALVQSALRQWSGPAIQVQGVDVAANDGQVQVTVRYLELATGQLRHVSVDRS